MLPYPGNDVGDVGSIGLLWASPLESSALKALASTILVAFSSSIASTVFVRIVLCMSYCI